MSYHHGHREVGIRIVCGEEAGGGGGGRGFSVWKKGSGCGFSLERMWMSRWKMAETRRAGS